MSDSLFGSQSHEFTVIYDQESILSANRRFLARSAGRKLTVVFGLLLVIFVFLLASGDRGWLVGSYGAVLALGVGLWVAVSRAYIGRGMKRLQQMHDSRATITLTDSHLGMRSELGAAEVPWTQFKILWKYADLWMLFYETNAFVTLPLRDMSAEAQSFIEHKVREVGGKVE